MDTFAHFLWTFAVYWKHPKRWWAGIIGMIPDLLSFGPLFVINILTGNSMRGPPSSIPSWVSSAYNVTHSFITLGVVALILWFAAREWFWLLGGWLLHIVIDIPSHTDRFFPTPFLWPLSDFHVSGVNWGTAWFMIANYSSLLLVYIWLIWKVPGPKKLSVKPNGQH